MEYTKDQILNAVAIGILIVFTIVIVSLGLMGIVAILHAIFIEEVWQLAVFIASFGLAAWALYRLGRMEIF
jgi:hypothetical protein